MANFDFSEGRTWAIKGRGRPVMGSSIDCSMTRSYKQYSLRPTEASQFTVPKLTPCEFEHCSIQASEIRASASEKSFLPKPTRK